jgi:N,N'-diacetyllegionaminate synthase
MKRVFVIAEAGVNHNGRLDWALDLVRAAAQAGADAVKFQTFKADQLAAVGTKTVEYQASSTGAQDQHEMLKRLELSEDDHWRIAEEAAACGIEFMSTAFDSASAQFLRKLGIRRIKVPSGEVPNHPFLRELARSGLPIILSTGMADLEEVRDAVAVIEEVQAEVSPDFEQSERLVVLHCTSAYPAPIADTNLAAMQTLARALDVEVGYSDHSTGTLLAPVAVGMGAKVIEKHFTLDRSLPGPDHAASLEPQELRRMIEAIRAVELAVGDGIKAPQPSELEARRLVRRGIKASRDLAAGSCLSEDAILLLRPATGIAPKDLPQVIGRRLARSLRQGEAIEWPDLT